MALPGAPRSDAIFRAPHVTFSVLDPWTFHGPLEDSELMAEREILEREALTVID